MESVEAYEQIDEILAIPNFEVISLIFPDISIACCSVSSWQGPAIKQDLFAFDISIVPHFTVKFFISYDFLQLL